MAGYKSQSSTNTNGLSYEALLTCKTNIGGLFFDGFMKVSHESTLTVTEHPVESGASIVDNSYVNPRTIEMQIMMSDALSSVGVIIAAVFIKFFGWVWLDPVITIVVAVLVLREAIKIVVESINVLMESNPDIDLEKIHQLVLEVPEVKNIHHVHVWRFSDEQIMMDAHINVDESLNVMELEEIYDKISKKLYNECTINHLTLQAEGERGLKEKMIEVKQND